MYALCEEVEELAKVSQAEEEACKFYLGFVIEVVEGMNFSFQALAPTHWQLPRHM